MFKINAKLYFHSSKDSAVQSSKLEWTPVKSHERRLQEAVELHSEINQLLSTLIEKGLLFVIKARLITTEHHI